MSYLTLQFEEPDAVDRPPLLDRLRAKGYLCPENEERDRNLAAQIEGTRKKRTRRTQDEITLAKRAEAQSVTPARRRAGRLHSLRGRPTKSTERGEG